MTQIHSGHRTPANRRMAKPPPATTTHHNYVYTYTRIEEIRYQLAKLTTHPMRNRPQTLRPNQARIDGKTYERNVHDGDTICNDCGVDPGGYHSPRCDREYCPKCRQQMLTCPCEVFL